MKRGNGISSADGKLHKPDLVIKNWEGVFITDITTCHENGNCLERGDWFISKKKRV
jgi:hypothetical protein